MYIEKERLEQVLNKSKQILFCVDLIRSVGMMVVGKSKLDLGRELSDFIKVDSLLLEILVML